MNVSTWQRKNRLKRRIERLKHPFFLYRQLGGLDAIVTRADGSKENLGRIADIYVPRKGWAALTGGGTPQEE